jgi:hypothetical protein
MRQATQLVALWPHRFLALLGGTGALVAPAFEVRLVA